MTQLESILHVTLSGAVFLLTPLVLIYPRFFPVSRVVIALAVLGVYAVVAPFKPAELPLWSIWLAAMMMVFCVRHYREGKRERFWNPVRFWPVPVILIVGFALFLWRWDPPGIESAVVGAAARQTAFAQHFSLGTDGGAVSLLVAMANLGYWAPIERLVGFFTAVGAVLFVFCLASALGIWFERSSAFVGALFAMVIFAAPQALLASGAAPILFGLTSGCCLLEFSKLVLLRRATWWEWGLYSLAISLGAYCDAGAFLVSHAVCLPGLVWAWWVCESRTRFLRNVGSVLGLTALLTFPVLWPALAHMSFSNPAPELTGAFPLAASAALVLGIVAAIVDKRARYVLPASAGTAVASVLWCLAVVGKLPPSFQRSAEAMAVFPLAMPVAWLADRHTGEWRKPMRLVHGAVFGAFAVIAFHHFYFHLWPEFAAPQLTPRDRAAMGYVESYLPENDCVQVDPGYAGRWIPTLSHRCVTTSPKKSKWLFLAEGEPRPALLTKEPVFHGGALIYRIR